MFITIAVLLAYLVPDAELPLLIWLYTSGGEFFVVPVFFLCLLC